MLFAAATVGLWGKPIRNGDAVDGVLWLEASNGWYRSSVLQNFIIISIVVFVISGLNTLKDKVISYQFSEFPARIQCLMTCSAYKQI